MSKFVLSMDQSLELILRQTDFPRVQIRQKDGQEYWGRISRLESWPYGEDGDAMYVTIKNLSVSHFASSWPNGMIIRTDRLESVTLVWEREGGLR